MLKLLSLKEFSKSIPLKLNNKVKINKEIIKIMIVKKYLFISLKSKLIFENIMFIHKNILWFTERKNLI